MTASSDESIGLTSRGPYLDDTNAHSDSHISASDTLLEDDAEYMNANFQQSRWRKLFSSRKQARRKPSRPGNDFAEKRVVGRRKKTRTCVKAGLGILVLL